MRSFAIGLKAKTTLLSAEIADLNGDGKMEIMLKGLYSFGGMSTKIYESGKNGLKKNLFVECGD